MVNGPWISVRTLFISFLSDDAATVSVGIPMMIGISRRIISAAAVGTQSQRPLFPNRGMNRQMVKVRQAVDQVPIREGFGLCSLNVHQRHQTKEQ